MSSGYSELKSGLCWYESRSQFSRRLDCDKQYNVQNWSVILAGVKSMAVSYQLFLQDSHF